MLKSSAQDRDFLNIQFECKAVSFTALCFITAGMTQNYFEPILGPNLEKVSSLILN